MTMFCIKLVSPSFVTNVLISMVIIGLDNGFVPSQSQGIIQVLFTSNKKNNILS